MSERDDAADDSFRPIRTVEEPVHSLSREAARSGYRVFRAQGGFEAAIPDQVIARALAIGRRSSPNEWHGHLVGRIFDSERGRHAVIDGIVPDPDAHAWPSFVETTPESELRTRTAARLLFPDAIVLGWIHGHVGHGARFSGTDRKTQESWRQPHALGMVVDPWAPDAQVAVYRGPDSELLAEARPEMASHPEAILIVEPPAGETPAAPRAEPRSKHKKPGAVSRWLGAASLVAMLAMAIGVTCVVGGVRAEIRLLKERLRRLESAAVAREPPAPESCRPEPFGPFRLPAPMCPADQGPACWPDGRGE